MTWIDLHLHSNHSDGAHSPAEMVARAAGCGAVAVAITDHDTVSGVAEAREAARLQQVALLAGVEISAEYEGRELHVVGLGLDVASPVLAQTLEAQVCLRQERFHNILDRLRRVGLTLQPAPAATGAHMPSGRMHAAVTLRDSGVVRTVQQAFDRFLNRGCPAWVPKSLPPAVQVIETIQHAGGLAFLAHPGLGKYSRNRLMALLELPFNGLEAWHPSHTPAMTLEFRRLAEERGLLLSGGSDCHGGIKGDRPTLGRIKTPADCHQKIIDTLSHQSSKT